MADDDWFNNLTINTKLDYKRKDKTFYKIAIIKRINKPKLYICQYDYECSSTDESDYEDNWLEFDTAKHNIKRIAPLNTFAVYIIRCAQLQIYNHPSQSDKSVFHFKHNDSILKVSSGNISEYIVDSDNWENCITMTGMHSNLMNYSAVIMEHKNKIYLFAEYDKLNCIEYNINECILKSIEIENDGLINFSHFDTEKITDDVVVHQCYVPSTDTIYFINRKQFIKFTMDDDNHGKFEIISNELCFNAHSKLMYSESLNHLITFNNDDTVYNVWYCDIDDYEWKQYQTAFPKTPKQTKYERSQFIFTMVYGHFLVIFEIGNIWFFDLLFDKVFKCDKDFVVYRSIDHMEAINYNNEYIHLIKRYKRRGYLFDDSAIGDHVKIVLSDIIPLSMDKLYALRKQLLCVGYISEQQYSITIPVDVVALITSFFSFFN